MPTIGVHNEEDEKLAKKVAKRKKTRRSDDFVTLTATPHR